MSWRQRFGCQSSRKSGSAGSPVERRRKSARSSRNASPDRRAARTAGAPPVARSYSSSPSTTLIVVSNDVRVEPLARSQFQPPSGCRSPSRRSTIAVTSTPNQAPSATVRPLMHSSTSPCQNGWPPSSQRAFSPTSATVARALAEAGSRPSSRSWLSAKWVAVQGWPSACHASR